MMKFLIPAALCALTLPSATLADWNGSYAGISLGQASNLEYEPDVTADADLSDGDVTGLFFGVRADRNGMVWGGEIAFEAIDGAEAEGGDVDLEAIFDAKAIGGIPSGDLLFYGMLSLSSTSGNYGAEEVNATGFGIGLGAAYQVGGNFSLGVEYMSRSLEAEVEDEDVDVTADTLTLRAAYKF